MSAYVGLNLLSNLKQPLSIDKELFFRAITGVVYENDRSDALILNTIIGMLNGHVNDVDKLDDPIRETEFDEAAKKELSARILRELRCELKALASPRGEEETEKIP